MRGKTSLLRMNRQIANTTSVQTVRPTLGVISHELLDAAIGVPRMFASGAIGLEEEGDEPADEAVEEGGLGQCEAKPLDRGDFVAHLGLAGDRLDPLAGPHAHA